MAKREQERDDVLATTVVSPMFPGPLFYLVCFIVILSLLYRTVPYHLPILLPFITSHAHTHISPVVSKLQK